ncbi:MAG: cysteine desulfurase [Planctomycetes bacterium]|nr:cysteine desulfurase [Planctomycetota bacterium]
MTRRAATATAANAAGLDIEAIRRDFPILESTVHGHPLVYLDNAATGQKPRATIDAVNGFYRTTNANIHRGVHHLSIEATRRYEDARGAVQRFLGAGRPEEIVFVRGATEAINLVAATWGRANVGRGDEVLVSQMEHHSNIVPWQMLCEQTGASLRVIPITDRGELDMEAFEGLLTDRTKIVACVHVSNSLGTINPVEEIIARAHDRGALVLLDGAQAAPHLPVDVKTLGCDFYAIAGHKIFGPSGIGALYARHDLLEAMPPYQGGGEMILTVSFEKTTYNKVPHKFEAGTPNIAGAVGLGATIEYLERVGMERITAYEHTLLEHATGVLAEVPGLTLIGTAPAKAAVLSFTLDGVHPHDIGTILDQQGIAVRTGHHCTQPVMDRFGIPATARASLAFYNTTDEIDALARGLHTVREVFG